MKNLDRTKDIFLDTVFLNDEILFKKIKNISSKLTIILSSFHDEYTLKKVIGNLKNQTFKEYDIIIVDDGLTTGIEELDEIYNFENNISYIRKQLGSASAAKNCGLEFSKGEYIIFLDDNIVLENTYLETLYNSINSNSGDIAVVLKDNDIFLKDGIYAGKKYLKEEIKTYKDKLNVNLSSYIFKKKFLNIYNLQFSVDLLVLENIYFKVKSFDAANKVVVNNVVMYSELEENYSSRNDAMIETSSRRTMNLIEKIEEFKEKSNYKEYLELLCGYLFLNILKIQNDESEKKSMLDIIKSKIKYFDKDTAINKFLIKTFPELFIKYSNKFGRG